MSVEQFFGRLDCRSEEEARPARSVSDQPVSPRDETSTCPADYQSVQMIDLE